MNDLQIGLVAVPLLITGIVQAVKNLTGMSGRPVRALALALGVFFVGLDACLDQGFFTSQAALIIETGVYSLAGGLAAMGYYDLGKQFLGQPEPLEMSGEDTENPYLYTLTPRGEHW